MPLFIMISGYFSRKKEAVSFRNSILKLVKVYLIFHVFWIVVDVMSGNNLTFERIFCPSFTLWYLHCLILWRFCLQFIPQAILGKPLLVLIITSFISILAGFIPVSNFMAIQRLLTFFPLFFLGYYAKKYGWVEKISLIKWYYLFVPIIIIFFENKIYLDIWGRTPYMSLIDVARRVVFLSSSILISIGLLRVWSVRHSFFAQEGKDVLFYYMYHSIVLYCLAYLLRSAGLQANGLYLLLISIVTMLLLFLFRKVKVLHALLK
jgi:fucose 4-O-acetylase-like acetyltransferase